MVKSLENNQVVISPVRARIRLDFKGTGKKALFGGKSPEKMAEEIRDQQAALLRNVPWQGVIVEEIDMGLDIYTVTDEVDGREMAFAPLIITVRCDTLEEILPFIVRDEFRKIEILAPADFVMDRLEIERLLFRLFTELKRTKELWEKRLNNR
ncbi:MULTISPECIES: hypothetical protein [Carboxydocella]|uniref:Uncharacterized protein n=2 Tax=Carboxydocella TaxID=178898 RepID=A0A1T4MPP8_9FIRM|nr:MULTISPECIES: hypothetical protein [Carboxydocella]AVX20384.1 hypothetical protein CFE_1189 [Carboxydocella thermautotrophica]AVX30808.1 hypothetical protein CTH_1211 [Carboxydocella thermautotrophica]SJZ68933.1 hypothetical protein SAMN02745885_00653 [Carboxydocella sporoproducens DSM 16521]GAW30047.1 hypothetical protein ULO1_26170 [Carboxydocella sp. ULO1]GAW31213.1 hypothetical protein JDF658_09780 [Carboxydocella sp. JDF658]